MLGRLIALVVPLGIDRFVVAAAIGLQDLSRRQELRISALFATFEGGMPLVGLLVGRPLGTTLGNSAEYLAIAVLMTFGLFTVVHGDNDKTKVRRLAVGGSGAILLGISVSLDELAIGFTLGLLHLPVVPIVIAVAIQPLS
jgi:putative Mn2+ efflux pump MntP